ncbi:hypothetical protein CpMRi49_09760 [Corynebacterium ulcerans]|nr:hypothetical protein CpMRi49_09760 [Corynebacterium ulcerans]
MPIGAIRLTYPYGLEHTPDNRDKRTLPFHSINLIPPNDRPIPTLCRSFSPVRPHPHAHQNLARVSPSKPLESP